MDLVLHWEIQSWFPNKRKNSQDPLSGPLFCWLSCNLSYCNLISSQVVAWKIANPEDYVWQVLNHVVFNSTPIYSQILWKDRQRNMRYKKKLRGCYTREHFSRTTARSGVASFVGGCGGNWGNWVKFVPPKLFRKGPEASLLPPFLPLGGGWGKGKTKKKGKRKKPRWTLGRAGALNPVFDCSKKNFLLLNVANVLFTILFSRQCLIKVNN